MLGDINQENLNVSFIQIEQEDEKEANWEDYRHMNSKFLTYILGQVAEKHQTLTGEQFFLHTTEWTTERKYSQVKSTYRLGCESCTEMGHSKEKCHLNKVEEEKQKKRKGRNSGSELPNAKKVNSS